VQRLSIACNKSPRLYRIRVLAWIRHRAAPTLDLIRVSTTTPGILGIPSAFPIAPGAQTKTFEVHGLHAGIGLLRIQLPETLGSGELEANISVHDLAVPVVRS